MVNGANPANTLPSPLYTSQSGWAGWANNVDATVTQYTYDDLGNFVSQVDGLSRTTSFTYNQLGQRTTRTLPDLSVERWTYDVPITGGFLHRQVHTDLAGRTTVTEFDTIGRVTQKYPLSSASLAGGTGSVAATASFNPAGANNALKFTAGSNGADKNGITIVFIADATITTDSANASYDSYGQILTIRYSSTLTTALTVRTAVNGVSQLPFTAALDTSSSPGDGAGNNGTGPIGAGPSSDSTWVTFTYTPAGQRSTMTDNKGTSSERLTRYAYDETARLRVKQSPQGTLTYTYDPAGNITEVSARNGYTFPGTKPWVYNSASQAANSRLAGADMVYTYDAGRKRIYQVFGFQSVLRATYTFDASGNLATLSYGNGLVSSYTNDIRNRLRFLATTNSALNQIATFDYDNYQNGSWSAQRLLAGSGMRQGMAELINYSGTSYRRVVAYDYDVLNRLRAERVRSGTGGTWPAWAPDGVPTAAAGGDVLYDFTPGYDSTGFDKVSNRLSRTVGAGVSGVVNQSFAGSDFDSRDRLKYVASPASYDGNGNQLYQSGYVSPTTPNQVVPSSSNPDQYDLENRLTRRASASTVATFVYDGDGNRVIKTVTGVNTHYLVDDRNPTGYAQVIEEQPSAGGNPTVMYTYGVMLICQDRGAVSYYGLDGQGSVRYLTSTAGVVTDTYTYDAFGILEASNGSTANNYRYVGEQWDPELGMYYLRARYYHPDVGRFWTMDGFDGEIEEPQSLHKYLYCSADPVNALDPTGNYLMTEQNAVMYEQYQLRKADATAASLAQQSMAQSLVFKIGAWTIIGGVVAGNIAMVLDALGPQPQQQYFEKYKNKYFGVQNACIRYATEFKSSNKRAKFIAFRLVESYPRTRPWDWVFPRSGPFAQRGSLISDNGFHVGAILNNAVFDNNVLGVQVPLWGEEYYMGKYPDRTDERSMNKAVREGWGEMKIFESTKDLPHSRWDKKWQKGQAVIY